MEPPSERIAITTLQHSRIRFTDSIRTIRGMRIATQEQSKAQCYQWRKKIELDISKDLE
jgi:hypothetical protein